jgi:hypothetical protein
LGGTVVAYCVQQAAEGERIIVRSIRTGRVLHKFWLSVDPVRATENEWAEALRIFVTSYGAVAWLQEDSFGTHDGNQAPPREYDVYEVDSTGFHALSTALLVEPQAMKLVGNALTWRQETTPESAVLE